MDHAFAIHRKHLNAHQMLDHFLTLQMFHVLIVIKVFKPWEFWDKLLMFVGQYKVLDEQMLSKKVHINICLICLHVRLPLRFKTVPTLLYKMH